MCSSFEAQFTLDQLQRRFGLNQVPQSILNKLNKRPTDEILTLTAHSTAKVMQWGLRTDWSNQPVINTRSETLLQKQFFARACENRCLVPATAWFEWRKEGRNKFKNRIAIQGVQSFAMAAIYEGEHCSILTCAPHPSIAHIHNRMPVLIAPPFYEQWLAPEQSTQSVLHLACPPQNIAFHITEEQPATLQLDLL